MRIEVEHSIGDLADDLEDIARESPVDIAETVRYHANWGFRVALAFASEQHTMNSDIDVPYQQSFSAEARDATTWDYGPERDGIPHGGQQAKGYENGSKNQRPHLNLDRSLDIIAPAFRKAVHDLPDEWFW